MLQWTICLADAVLIKDPFGLGGEFQILLEVFMFLINGSLQLALLGNLPESCEIGRIGQ